MVYIAPGFEKNLIQFKYKGGTSSISYEYLWSPMDQFILRKFIPKWIAPNLITLIAFLLVVVSHVFVLYYKTASFQEELSSWKYILFGVTILIYQHLDNIDGKQARRTKSSSPIGMLFDHGADAITGIIFGIQIARVINLQCEELTFYVLGITVLLPNFAGLWMQYSVGQFKLDRVNPIDQGLPSYALLSICGAIFNYSFWNQHHWIATYNQEFVLFFCLAIILIIVKMNLNIFKQSLRQKSDVAQKLWLPVILLSWFALVKILGLTNIYADYFPFVLYSLMFFWGRNMMLIQVSYVTKQYFNVFNRGTIFFMVSWLIYMFGHTFFQQHIRVYLAGICLIQFIILGEFIYSFLTQAAHLLKIKVFSIPLIESNDKNK